MKDTIRHDELFVIFTTQLLEYSFVRTYNALINTSEKR